MPHLGLPEGNFETNFGSRRGSFRTNVGLKHEKGEGTIIDNERAIYWYSQAAFNQNDVAQFRLASLLQKQPLKLKDSHFWFTKSAQLGNPEAYLALATNFILGRGVEKNLTLATRNKMAQFIA